jgi:N-6 DNA Methylase
MAHGGLYGLDRVDWFNGSLFDNDVVLPLEVEDLTLLETVAALNWSAIEPAIFGTLFERGLDPSKRSQLGAHYTDPRMIERIVDAVIARPLLAEWAEVRDEMTRRLSSPSLAPVPPVAPRPRRSSTPTLFESLPIAGPAAPRQRARRSTTTPEDEARVLRDAFLERLKRYRVLDPACGSGNFLYIALKTLKDIELQVIIESESLGLARVFPLVGPEAVLGIEKNSYAVELARVTVWIGEIQWMLRKGYDLSRDPVLSSLPGIVEMDAILDPDSGEEPDWPSADVIVGNPPFLGSRFHLRRLGTDYVRKLRERYDGRISAGADLVCYWFEKARAMAARNNVSRVGLLATKSIANAEPSRQVLDRIIES